MLCTFKTYSLNVSLNTNLILNIQFKCFQELVTLFDLTLMVFYFIYTILNGNTFMSRVGLASKCVDQGDVELIGFDKEFLFLLLQASCCC